MFSKHFRDYFNLFYSLFFKICFKKEYYLLFNSSANTKISNHTFMNDQPIYFLIFSNFYAKLLEI